MPDLPSIVVRGFRGLSLKADTMNRDPRSWQTLDYMDLFIDGSIRSTLGWIKYGQAALGKVQRQVFEYRLTDSSANQIWAIDSTTPQLVRLDAVQAPVPLPAYIPANFSGRSWVGLLPGIKIPYVLKTWIKSTAYSAGQAIIKYSIDGNQYVYVIATPGNSGTQEPVWPMSGSVNDNQGGGTAVWTNVAKLTSGLFGINYAFIQVPGYQAFKFDGVSCTEVGISAPGLQVGVQGTNLSTVAAQGITIQFGRQYAWTWFNPNTLVESSPSPVLGMVTFFATDIGNLISQSGSTLPPSPAGQAYAQVVLGLPPLSVLQHPPIGQGFTNVRVYATKDGGSVLFLVQTLYDNAGNIVTDGNSSVAISTLPTQQGYLPTQATQAKTNITVVNDGFGSGTATVQDSVGGQDGTIEGTTPTAVSSQTPGILPSDPDSTAVFDGFSGYISTPATYTDPTNDSLFCVFQTSTTLGGPLVGLTESQVGTPIISDRFIYMNTQGKIGFAWFAGGWHKMQGATPYNDGVHHDVLVVCGATSHLYVDGVQVDTTGSQPSRSFPGFWRIGGEINCTAPSLDAHNPKTQFFAGAIGKVAYFNASLGAGDATALHTAANNGTLDATVETTYAASVQNYWRLNDVSSPTIPTLDAALFYPSPLYGANNPPPVGLWATIYQGSVYIVDFYDRTKAWYTQTGLFEAVGINNFLTFPSEKDSAITAMIGTSDRLIVGTTRNIQQITGADPTTFQRLPIDAFHGIVGKSLAMASGSQLICMLSMGIASINMILRQSPAVGEQSDQVQLGFSPLSLIGNDVQPITNTLDPASLNEVDTLEFDTINNRILFLLTDVSLGGTGFANYILALQLDLGFSRLPALPAPFSIIKEVFDPISQQLIVLGIDNTGQPWQYLNAPQGSPNNGIAVATTQALPTPEQADPETRNARKVFTEVWIEGTNVGDYNLSWSIDGKAYPTAGQQVVAGLNRLGGNGKLITLTFTRKPGITSRFSLISYYKIKWTLQGKSS